MVNKDTNICDNVTVWDGNPDTWTPPAIYLMLPQNSTPAKNWIWDDVNKIWVLETQGVGGIGYTWDGVYLVTPEPQPIQPVLETIPGQPQPDVSGAQTL